MLEKRKLRQSVQRAERILSERAAVLTTLANEVARLTPLISDRLSAECNLAEIAATDALAAAGAETEVTGSDALSHALEKLQKQSIKLRGLRARLSQQVTELEAAHQELVTCLPACESDLRGRLESDWAIAIATVDSLLARRQALETALAKKIELAPVPQYQPAAGSSHSASIDDIEALSPFQLRDSLLLAVSDIAGWASMPDVPLSHPLGAASYDASLVYQLTDPFNQMAAGTLVVEATFGERVLAWLVRSRQAVPVCQDSHAVAAQQAKARMESQPAEAPAPEPTPERQRAAQLAAEAAAFNRREGARETPGKHETLYIS